MSKRSIIRTMFVICSCIFSVCSSAQADCPRPCVLSDASELSAYAIASVVAGSLQAIVASGRVVVESVKPVANGFVIVLKSVSSNIRTSVRVSRDAVRGSALAVGATVEFVAYSTGYMLVATGQAIAFIPNTIGEGLLHQSRVQ